jgi:putative ABC transport system permease protein
LGCTTGTCAGFFGLGSWLFEDFTDLYSVPEQTMEMSYIVPAAVTAVVVFSTLTNYLSCRKLLVQNASEILKPEVPKAGGAGGFEKIFLWKYLSFATKWNLRDININRVRSIMGVFGVVICSSVLMGAFGFDEILNSQDDWIYNDLRPANYTINLSEDSGYSWAYDYSREFMGQMVMVSDAELTSRTDSRLFTVTVVDEGNLYHVQNEKREYLNIPGFGAIISTKAADTLGVKAGDTLSFRLAAEKKTYSINVTDICKAPDVQGIILSRNCFEKLGGYFEPRTIYTNMTVPDSYAANRKEITGVISKKEYIRALKRTTQGLNEVVMVIIVIGIIVGFTSMYNMGILSYMEKTRDIATLKVLGFATGKIRWILQQQNLFITGLGTILGIPIGLLYIDLLIDTMNPTADFMVDLSYVPYVRMILFSFVLSIIVNGQISRRVKSINMVEALKGVE